MRKDQQLSEKYKKSERFEKVISSLNKQLEIAQNELLELKGEEFSTLHILGAPRSGTTLVSQLIPSFLDVAHINNFIATFWKAPIYGIELSKKLIPEKYASNFASDFGRTSGLNEPHEFGYFWNYHLKYDGLQQKETQHQEQIDWDNLSRLLNNMTHAFEKPIVFKSFLMGFHASRFHQEMPKSKFIYIKRNLVDNVLSILKLRNQLNGDSTTWGSIKPKQYEQLKDLNVYEQIVGQILCLENEYLNQLKNIPEGNKMIVSYEEICKNPNGFLNQVQSLLGNSSHLALDNLPIFEIPVKNEVTTQLAEIEKAKTTILKLFPNLNLLNL